MSLGIGHEFIVAFGEGVTPTREVDGMGRVGSIVGLAGVILTASVHPAIHARIASSTIAPP